MKYTFLKYPWGPSWCGMMFFTGRKNLLIDSAVPEALPFLEAELSAIGFQVRDIDIVANSHNHGDHTGMNAGIKEISGAEIWEYHPDADGSCTIDCGDYKLLAIPTPGHTADSIAFLEPSQGIIFTGDTFEGRGSSYAGIALYNDPEALLLSIEKVRALYDSNAFEKMFLGHAYHGTCGVLEKSEIPDFLNTSRDTILAYNDLIKSLPEDVSAADAAAELRKHFGITENTLHPKAAESTARAHLAYIGR